MSFRLRYTALSDVGRVRRDNQDSGYAGEHLLAIADGVGGAARGDIASSAAVEQLRRLDVQPGSEMLAEIGEAIHRAHDRIAEIVEENPELEGTSTTVTVAAFDGTHLGLGHVGDSRGYLLRDGTISQLTKDHTFVQSLIDEGRITEDEARVHPHRNLILRAVDGVHEPEPDLFTLELAHGDRILLCSDGCSGVLANDDLARIGADGPVDRVAVELIRSALDAGSTDNVTVVLADVVDDDRGATVEAAALTENDLAAGEGDAPEDTSAGASTGPMLVGAAAEQPRRGGRGRMGGHHGGGSGDTGELDAVPGGAKGGGKPDPEALRYAPREPRRFLWLRRVGVLVIIAVLIWLIGTAGYAWTQTQYYVAESSGNVAIYKGVEAEVPGLKMHSVHDKTAVKLATLPTYNARQVRDGIGADNLDDAKTIVKRLQGLVVCPAPLPVPPLTPKTTKTPATESTQAPSRQPASTPTASATGTATGTPTGTPSGTPTSPTAPADGSCSEVP